MAALFQWAHADTLCPIEVGSGGVKGRVFELSYDAHGRLVTKTDLSIDDNPDVMKTITDNHPLPAAAIAAAASSVARVDAQMKDKYPHCLQFVVGSSGVAMASNTADLTKAVAAAGYPGMTFVDATQEALYGFRSGVPSSRRAKALLIDIGGGNTKMGYMDSAKRFQSMEIRLGSLTSAQAASATGMDPMAGLATVILSQVLPKFREDVKTHPEVLKQPDVYWVGGVAWATATYSHPEAIDQLSVKVTRSDIENFLIVAENNTWREREAPAKLTPAQKAAWDKEWADVKRVFGKQQSRLVAGVLLMKVILSQGIDRDEVTFPRYSDWIWGYSAEFFKIASPGSGR